MGHSALQNNRNWTFINWENWSQLIYIQWSVTVGVISSASVGHARWRFVMTFEHIVHTIWWVGQNYNGLQFLVVKCPNSISLQDRPTHDKYGLGMRLIWKLIIKPKLPQATYASTVHVSWF